ncbi:MULTISPECIES: ABC-three component system protein [Mycobacterium]|uniref:ABC-three component system protein n=1 Tax=Mycobacterium TaxID=1763 RepID=UPI0009ECD720|nr:MULTISPECIES: ABC-three component system protein [Mycobacterium]UQB93072.1 DUF2326 domain-containing protein [Mycobacterium intracellulare]WSE46215.1 ABC-three component system protein [Mycobacterium sp. 3-98]
MFLHEVRANDPRFKTIEFHDGLNLIVADRTTESTQGDSRNGTGKSSFIRILRYLLGGNLPDELRAEELNDHVFTGVFSFDRRDNQIRVDVEVSRPVSPTTKVAIDGPSEIQGDVQVEEWRGWQSTALFGLPEEAQRPTIGQLWGQLARTTFGNPVKSYLTDTDWETGTRLGFFMGLDPIVLAQAGEVSQLEKQRRAIRNAIREGALQHIELNEADLRSKLAAARRYRDRIRSDLDNFKVDQQYAEHQRAADGITARIQRLNDEGLLLERRMTELEAALEGETGEAEDEGLAERVARLYAEVGVILPESVPRRFEEVAEFHRSVVRNRRTHLLQERQSAAERLEAITVERSEMDDRRASIMRLLKETVALDTFLDAQQSLVELEAEVADLDRRLSSAVSINNIDTRVRMRTAEAAAAVRSEIEENSEALEKPISLFNELGSEVYSDREAKLLISSTNKGVLHIEPEIAGDASDGIRGVETFLLDMVCVVTAVDAGRAQPILVHDSHLFDAVDHRQIASCLKIGARLASEKGFQYIVSLNSDVLASVEEEGGFDSSEHTVKVSLTDSTSDGGLFGFRFN